MQYNKYALALVLLASSAFAAASVVEPDYEAVSNDLMRSFPKSSKKQISSITDKGKEILTPGQLAALQASNDDKLTKRKIIEILKRVYDEEKEAEKLAAETAKKPAGQQDEDLDGSNISNVSLTPLLDNIDAGQKKPAGQQDAPQDDAAGQKKPAGQQDAPQDDAAGQKKPAGQQDAPQDDAAGQKTPLDNKIEDEKDAREKAAKDLAVKVKAAIPADKSFDKMDQAEIDKLGLTSEQVEALKKFKATNTSDIADILKKSKPVDSGAETSFFKTNLFYGIAGILVLSAIGGGAYMITRKSEETDL